MIEGACVIANSVLYIAFFLGFFRLCKGPETLDRILAFDLGKK